MAIWKGIILCVLVSCVTVRCSPLTDSCSPVADQFTQLGLGPLNLVPDSRIHDSDMEVCYKGTHDVTKTTCCTRQMERRYHMAAEELFIESLANTSSHLKNMLKDNAELYRNQFMMRLDEAANATLHLLITSHEMPSEEARTVIDALFLDLTMYLQQRDVSVHDSLAQFFDNLFLLVFRYSVNDPSVVGAENVDYSDCLTQIRQDLFPRPFGDVPTRLTRHLDRSLGTARVFLQAMDLWVETVDATTQMPADHSCSRALTRLSYCAHCDGIFDVRPCENFCVNVLRGCLAPVTKLSRPWDQFVDAVELLTDTMRDSYDVEESLLEFPGHVSDAILHATGKQHTFFPEIVKRCGRLSASPDVTPTRRTRQHTPFLPVVSGSEVRLQDKLSMLMRHLAAARGFYDRLPEGVCQTARFAADSEEQCWNGRDVGRYTASVVPRQFESQLEMNPEMHVSVVVPPQISLLSDKLFHMVKVLSSWAAEASPLPADQPWYFESPNRRRWRPSDDEDVYASGSGSGDVQYEHRLNRQNPGYQTRQEKDEHSEPDFNFSDDSPYKSPPPPEGPNGMAAPRDTHVLATLTLTLLATLYMHA